MSLVSRKPVKKEKFNSHPETYAPQLNFVMRPDSSFTEHSACTQNTDLLFMVMSHHRGRGEQQNAPKFHLIHLL